MPDDEPEVLSKMEESLISAGSSTLQNNNFSSFNSFKFTEYRMNLDGVARNTNGRIENEGNNWQTAKFSDAFSNSIFNYADESGRIRDYPALNVEKI